MIHLQTKSGYSFLRSVCHLETLVQQAKTHRMPALALTDENVLHGAYRFSQLCLQHGIAPIIGMELGVRFEEARDETLLLYAKNLDGYKTLCRLSYEKTVGTIDVSALEGTASELFCIYSTSSTSFKEALEVNELGRIDAIVYRLQEVFGESVFIGLQSVHSQRYTAELKNWLSIIQMPVVALGNVRSISAGDSDALRCVRAIQAGKQMEDVPHEEATHFRSSEEMEQAFSNWPEAIEQTKTVYKYITPFQFDSLSGELLKYPVPGEQSSEQYLIDLCKQGWETRYSHNDEKARARLTLELETIEQTGFSDYFLIVWDIVSHAKRRRIPVGPGRGSAAGSMVAYVLGITDVEPMRFGLLFERFLNPERLSMPDIDIDIADDRREEVIHYIQQRFGGERVAQIGTFGTLAAKAAIRDTAKAYGIPARDLQRLSSAIQSGKTIQENLASNPDIKRWINEHPRHEDVLNVATKIEGLPRHASIHAAGVVLNERPLLSIVPLQQTHSQTVTQYGMHDLEQLGLLKMDFLGLRNLSFIQRICRRLKSDAGTQLEPNKFPLDDEKALRMLAAGDTSGIFQFESAGMRKALQDVKPTSFQDLVAVSALYRPGPMQFIKTYARRKHGHEKVTYLHEALKPILETTYGVIVYQEQVMAIAHEVAGFSLGQADLLRRAMGKKEQQTMQDTKDAFIEGCRANGYEESTASQLFAFIRQFAQYGFNKSHAVAYTMISTQLAYLKARYPDAFYTELLNNTAGQMEKRREYLQECKHLDIPVMPPDINCAHTYFDTRNRSIYFGFIDIKHVGAQAAEAIIETRKERPFESFIDFVRRLPKKWLQRSLLESLIYAGSFDSLHANRAAVLATIDPALEYAELIGEEEGGLGMIVPPPSLQGANPLSSMEQLAGEKDTLGVYISGHPMDGYRLTLQKEKAIHLSDVQYKIHLHVSTGGIVQEVKEITTKKGEPMAFLRLSDASADLDCVIFPEIYRQIKPMIKEGKALLVQGKAEKRQGTVQLIFSSARPLSQGGEIGDSILYLQINANSRRHLQEIKNLLQANSGRVPVALYYVDTRRLLKLPDHYNTVVDTDLLASLQRLLGKENVALKAKKSQS
ncbi:DNA polymerase III subunit alpha [Aureibacillus halotolerans]|uniref:DNA polymerase III subunit alpha n=1 Tax=Aureibacillus halotolerans TaxID=1508390 RepID=A0A4R6U310_9BACI|nr:DNA polymerase III subunit alpha [Aureibacillus halotolerans]TDQ39133.1 DNA polymerase III catalytic subunit DnaE type [Aureibacillus halotolerans]